MKNFIGYFLLFCFTLGGGSYSCKDVSKKAKMPAAGGTGNGPAGYDFAEADRRTLKNKLNEISGIRYLKDSLLAAVQDEAGTVFTVDFASGEIREEHPFAGPGDYEDIAMDANFYYVLESSGKIFKVPRTGNTANPEVFALPVTKKMDFETLYLDASGQDLILICKSCSGNKGGKTADAYSFSLKNMQFDRALLFSLVDGAAQAVPEKYKARPSSAAIHPIENKLYVLCSIGKLLLVCDLEGKVEKAYPLDPAMFGQPEGITFSPNGDMYISNEAGNGTASIIKLPYKP